MAAQSGPLSTPPPPGRGAGRPGTGRLTERPAPSGSLVDESSASFPAEENDQELVEQEEQAVQTLKRLRTSGPLIIEEAMNNKDQMNEIIGQAVEGHLPEVAASETAPPPNLGDAERRSPASVSQVIKLDPARRDEKSASFEESPANGNGEDSDSSVSYGGQGPAQVLADASGLQTGSTFGAWLRIGLTILVLLVSTTGYLVYRDRLLANTRIGDDERKLPDHEELANMALAKAEQAAGIGGFEDALRYYERANTLRPNNELVILGLARTYAKLGRTDAALENYNYLTRKKPEDLVVRLERARIYQSRNDWPNALREFKMIIAFDQNSAQATIALEEMENHEAKKTGAAVPVRSLRKRVPKPLLQLPSSRIAQGEVSLQPPQISLNTDFRPPDSIDIDKSSEKPDPAAMVASRRDLGLRYLNIKEYRAAIKEFLIVLRLTPEDKDIYYFLASAYNGLEMYPEANDYYKRVDRGRYVQVAQSGAKRTQKLADQQRRLNP